MKIAIVTCSPLNDYARARSLRSAIAKCQGIGTLVIRRAGHELRDAHFSHNVFDKVVRGTVVEL